MLIEIIKRFFKKPLPIWAYGLECELCKKSFVSPQAHYNYVTGTIAEQFHNGRIPILRGIKNGKKRSI